MPSSKRDLLKRKHGAIENALLRAMGWTEELFLQFEPVHPEYAKGYANIHIMIEMARDSIVKMKGHI